MSRFIRSLILVVCAMIAAPVATAQAQPRTIICIDDVNDDFTNNAEGYLRAQYPNAIITRGGNLRDCMAQLNNGDTLIIVCHGLNNGEGFQWGGNNYFGFGTGPDDMPVPPGFGNLHNITVQWITCWSNNDPDGSGEDRPLTEKIRDAMGGAGNGHPMPTGYTGISFAAVNYSMSGGTAEQQAAARQCLTNNPAWQNNPPANRPGTGGAGQPANQQSAAQSQVSNTNCPGAGGAVTITIPNAVATPQGPNQPKTAGYKRPVDRPGMQVAAGVGGPTCTPPPYCGCSDPPEGISADDSSAIPAVSGTGLALIAAAVVVFGLVVVRRIGI